MAKTQENKSWLGYYLLLLLFEFVSQMGCNIINPNVSNYAIALGATISFAGFLAGLNCFVAFGLRFIANLVFAHMDKLKLFLASAVVFAVGSAICVLMESLGMLTVSRVFFGVAFALKSALIIVIVSSLAPKEHLGQMVGLTGLATLLANAVAPMLGNYLGGTYGYQIIFVLATVFFVICVAIGIFLCKELRKADLTSLRDPDGDAKLTVKQVIYELHPKRLFIKKSLPFVVSIFFEAVTYGIIWQLILLAGQISNLEGIEIYFAVYVIFAACARPFAGKAFDKLGFDKVFIPSTIVMSISPLVLVFADNLVMVGVSAALFALGQGTMFPAAQAENMRIAEDEVKTMAANTFNIGPDLGMFVGPVVGGIALEILGPAAMWIICAASGFLSLITFYLMRGALFNGKTHQ